MKEKKTFQPLTSKNICQIYSLLHSEAILSFPLTEEAEHKVESIVGNINGVNFDVPNYRTVETKAVAHLFFLINDHPFTDGNKRTAVLTFLILCDLNELDPNLTEFTLDELAVFLEQANTQDHHKVIEEVANYLFSDKKHM